ncbi:MAG: ComF family protein [Planctomycetaceae bacterium]
MTFLNHLRRNTSLLRRSAWEFVYPPTCVLCHCVIQHADDVVHPLTADHQVTHTERVEFCGECRAALSQPIVARCRRCDAPVGAYLGTSEKCVHCRDDRFAFSRVVSVGVYTGRLRHACLQCKNPEGRSLAMNLAELLWETRSADLRRELFDAVIPVPVHWWQRVVHSEGAQGSIAEVLSRRLNVLCDRHAVMKVRRTPPQASLVPSKRRVNLRDVFRLRGGSIWRGRRVLLVDDVLTTGTTVQRIARLFRDAGAEEIVIAVIARGLGDRFQFPSQNVTLSKKF